MKRIALTVRHALSGTLKGNFFHILKILEDAGKEIFLCPLAKKLVKNSENFSHLSEISELQKTGKFSSLDLFVFLGGDGTLLRTVNTYAPEIFDIPLFGVNAGNLGFFSSVTPDQMEAGFEQIFSRNFSFDSRMILEGGVFSGKDEKFTQKHKLYALNECVIHHNKIARLRKISAEISGEPLTEYKADGLIIASPTGSTAYNLAAGGPVVAAQMDAFILTPLAPSGFAQRPIVIPPQKILEFRVDGEMLLSLDGQQYFPISSDDIIQIKQHEKKLTFLRLSDENYYKNLREKLGWGM